MFQRVILFKIYVPRKYFREIDTGHKQNDIEPEDQLFKTISVNFSLKKNIEFWFYNVLQRYIGTSLTFTGLSKQLN